MKETILPLLAMTLATFAFAWPQDTSAGEAEQKISGPHTHDNLTIYFIHGKSAGGPVPLTLEEALEKGAVTVHETGSVAELAIENTGSDEVLVHAGDIVKGGQQDRVLTTTMILKPKSGRVPLASFCVEQGRWSARGKEDVKRFASAKEMMPSREAKLAMKVRAKEPAVAAGLVRERMAVEAERAFDRDGASAASTANVDPRDRQRVQEQRADRAPPGYNAQGEVWKNVAGIQAALSEKVGSRVSSTESESSLQLALENEKVNEARKRYVDALQVAGEKDSDIVGYAFAVNGKVNSADVYSSNALFKKLWPRLLKAAATEAMGTQDGDAKAAAPAPSAVDAFLADAAKGTESAHEPAKGIKLKVRDSAHAMDFETFGADGGFVHRNLLAK